MFLTGRGPDGTLGLLQGNRGTIQAGASRLHRLLAVSQIALAFVLVLSAGLLLATLRNLTAVDPGFDAERVAVSAAALPGSRYPDRDARLAFVRRMLDAIVAVPGVRSAAVASHLPFSGESSRNAVAAGQIAHAAADGVPVPYQTVVGPG